LVRFRSLQHEQTRIQGFEFEEGGRRYVCSIQEQKGAYAASWWWYSVSGDPQSYAPCRVEPTDTEASVREAVVKHYTNRLFQLSQPSQRNSHWTQRRPAAAAAAAAPVADDTVDESIDETLEDTIAESMDDAPDAAIDGLLDSEPTAESSSES
jgi:hypothetical protein